MPLFLLTLAVMGLLNLIGEPLKTEVAPQGIVSFELAGDVPTAQAILDSWSPLTRVHAGLSLGFDFLFMILYSTTIGLGCVWVTRGLQNWQRPWVAAGLWLAWGQWLAALLDTLENLALSIILLDAPATPWPQVARWCAIPKFLIVFLGIAYVLVSAVLRWARPRRLEN